MSRSGDERPSWQQYGLALADVAASRSEDPYRKVGAVVFRWDWSVLSVGYNGAPPGTEIPWDREARRDYVIHAEMNALRYASRFETTNGFLCSTHQPCEKCLPMIAAYGLKAVYYREPYESTFGSDRLSIIADVLGLRMLKEP